MTFVEKHTTLDVDSILKNLYVSKMEGEEFVSLLQV